jgi:hypothetical protein
MSSYIYMIDYSKLDKKKVVGGAGIEPATLTTSNPVARACG